MPNPIVKRSAGGYTTPEGAVIRHVTLSLADGAWWFLWRTVLDDTRWVVAVRYAKDGSADVRHHFTSS